MRKSFICSLLSTTHNCLTGDTARVVLLSSGDRGRDEEVFHLLPALHHAKLPDGGHLQESYCFLSIEGADAIRYALRSGGACTAALSRQACVSVYIFLTSLGPTE